MSRINAVRNIYCIATFILFYFTWTDGIGQLKVCAGLYDDETSLVYVSHARARHELDQLAWPTYCVRSSFAYKRSQRCLCYASSCGLESVLSNITMRLGTWYGRQIKQTDQRCLLLFWQLARRTVAVDSQSLFSRATSRRSFSVKVLSTAVQL